MPLRLSHVILGTNVTEKEMSDSPHMEEVGGQQVKEIQRSSPVCHIKPHLISHHYHSKRCVFGLIQYLFIS